MGLATEGQAWGHEGPTFTVMKKPRPSKCSTVEPLLCRLWDIHSKDVDTVS